MHVRWPARVEEAHEKAREEVRELEAEGAPDHEEAQPVAQFRCQRVQL